MFNLPRYSLFQTCLDLDDDDSLLFFFHLFCFLSIRLNCESFLFTDLKLMALDKLFSQPKITSLNSSCPPWKRELFLVVEVSFQNRIIVRLHLV